MLEIKDNLKDFKNKLQNILDEYPEISLISNRDGDIFAYDIEYFNPTTYEFKQNCKIKILNTKL